MRPGLAALFVSAAASAHAPPSTDVTWSREVVRIVARHCGGCHRRGGASFSLAGYAEARPWAKAIRDQVLERRMPPWPAARGVRALANDPTLPPRAVEIVAAWADGGAPEGDPADLPRDPPPSPSSRSRRLRAHRFPTGGVLTASRSTAIASLTPSARDGESVEVRIARRDGSREALLWIPRFDRRYRFTYALGAPAVLEAGDQLLLLPPSVALTFSEETPPPAPPR